MNDALKNIYTDLIDKKLWPVAALLVAGIVLVPMMLGKSSDPAAATPPAITGPASSNPTEMLALSRASKTGFDVPPTVRDRRADPFSDRGGLSEKEAEVVAETISTNIDSVLGGGGPSLGPSGPSAPITSPNSPSAPKDPDKGKVVTDDLLSIMVQEGETQPTQIDDIRTLSPAPNADDPFLIYVGPGSGDTAVFLVDAGVKWSGDGSCSPSPTDCQTLTLGVGETADFQLPLSGDRKVSITVLGIERAKVREGGDNDGQRARVVGAKAIKTMLKDRDVVEALYASKVKLARK